MEYLDVLLLDDGQGIEELISVDLDFEEIAIQFHFINNISHIFQSNLLVEVLQFHLHIYFDVIKNPMFVSLYVNSQFIILILVGQNESL